MITTECGGRGGGFLCGIGDGGGRGGWGGCEMGGGVYEVCLGR